MKKSIKILLEKYQVRKTKKQKQAFIGWLKTHLSGMGYTLKEDKYSKSGNNLIVGDVETAEIIITAHYDTQPNAFFPLVMAFSNWGSFIFSQIVILLPLSLIYLCCFAVVSAFAGAAVASVVCMWLLFAYCIQILCGVANRHTSNDNTSGVATLIAILEDVPEEERKKICLVFFDQEELGLIGARKFHKKYKRIVENKPLINFDCVADGDTLTFVVKKKFKNSKYFELLTAANNEAMKDTSKKSRFADALWNIYSSDQLCFRYGVGVVAAKKAPLAGYYIDRIHSKWDTRFDNENILLLSDTVIRMIRSI